MRYQNISELPQDVADKLSDDAKPIYMAAYNSIIDSNGSPEAASRVAWETIERDENYVQDGNGKWHRFMQTIEGKAGALPTMQGA